MAGDFPSVPCLQSGDPAPHLVSARVKGNIVRWLFYNMVHPADIVLSATPLGCAGSQTRPSVQSPWVVGTASCPPWELTVCAPKPRAPTSPMQLWGQWLDSRRTVPTQSPGPGDQRRKHRRVPSSGPSSASATGTRVLGTRPVASVPGPPQMPAFHPASQGAGFHSV